MDLLDAAIGMLEEGTASRREVEELFAALKEEGPHLCPWGWPTLKRKGAVWPEDLDCLVSTRRPPAEIITEKKA